VVFAHDTEAALLAAAELVNTTGRDGEKLAGPDDLAAFVAAHRFTGRHEKTAREVEAVRALRPRLRRLWDAREDEVVDLVNTLLREGSALPQLVRHDGWPYHLHATPSDAPLADRMAVEAAMAMVDVVREGELRRLRTCEFPDCDNVLVDLSKNRSKRFCDAGCGNRAAVNAYRARRAAQNRT
jgi:predicted RNA-binding Zn ribbon-like protein